MSERAAKVTNWLVGRHRTRLDLILMFGLGCIIGSHAYSTWWGRMFVVAALVGQPIVSAALRQWLTAER